MTLLACLLLTAGALVFIFYPGPVARLGEKTRLEFLRERKDVLYDSLRDLNFDYHAGKYREEEYASERAGLENEAAEVIGEMEALETMRR